MNIYIEEDTPETGAVWLIIDRDGATPYRSVPIQIDELEGIAKACLRYLGKYIKKHLRKGKNEIL